MAREPMTDSTSPDLDDAYDRQAVDPVWNIRPDAPVCPEAIVLYKKAFEAFSPHLWNVAFLTTPTAIQVLNTARALRQNGSLAARYHAENMEAAIRATLSASN
jgi:hypothetical protein